MNVANAGKRKKKILVVNDTQEILDLFRDILEDEGYDVSLYSYAFDDLVEVKRVNPDLILLDLIIDHEAHGWQLLQKLRMDRQTMTTPIIVCTAAIHLVRNLEGHLKEKGVGIVLKPFDIDDLVRAVNRCWDGVARDAAEAGTQTAPSLRDE